MTSLILSIFLIPLIILFNSFLLGKLVQRYSININSYMATVIGFFIYLAILFIFISLLYISTAIILVYLIFFICIQGMLLALYIWNYRYTFITYYFKKKPLIFFVTLLGIVIGMLVITITLIYHFHPLSSEMKDVVNSFNNNFKEYTNQIKFYDDTFTFENFSIFVIIAAIFRPLFNISDNLINNYLFWQQIITFGVIFSCVFTGFFYDRINNSRYWLQIILILICFTIFSFSFMFYESPIAGYSWVSIPIVLYCYQTFHRVYRDDRLTNNLLLVIVIGLTALNVELTLITILLLLFNFCYTAFKKYNPVGQTLYCFFPFLYVFFLWMPLLSTIPYAILLTIWLIASLVMILLYSRNFFHKVLIKTNKIVHHHPLFIVVLISIIFYTLSIFFLITVFNYQFSWRLWPENYNYIWGFDLQKFPNFNLFFNVGSWVALTIILIGIISTSIVKKLKFKEQPYLFLILLMIFLFINPLTLNLFLKITEKNQFNLLDLGLINFLIIVPLGLWLAESISNKSIFNLERRVNGQNQI